MWNCGKRVYWQKWLNLILAGGFAGFVTYYFYPKSALPTHSKIDKLVVIKSKRQLLAYSHDRLLKTYRVSLGNSPVGPKQVEGDGKTPEGHYHIDSRNARSQYYKNLGISYPNAADKRRAAQAGYAPGDAIKIHGLPNGLDWLGRLHRWHDWTAGCIAVTNQEIDELYEYTPLGTPIEIKP